MFLLRRTAARAIASSPSTAFLIKPRSITTITPGAFRTRQHKWLASSFQKRFASDEVVDTTKKTGAEEAAVEASESFAQTATEAPVEQNLTPAQQSVQAESTDASHTVDADGLERAIPSTNDARAASRQQLPPKEPNKVIYVGNLYYEVTADQLRRVFSRFGEIESTKIVYDNRGLSRGFGYVEFKALGDARNAVENLDMQVFEGRNLVVQFHKAKDHSKTRTAEGSYEPNPPSNTLFIGNMSFEMSDKDLNDLFRDIRNVVDVRVAIDRRTGQPRGFAHAEFIDTASAVRAKDVLNNKVLYGRQLRLDFSKPSARMDSREGTPSMTDGA